MSPLVENLVAGLILAAVSAVTLLAYYHPHAYKKIYLPLMGLLLLTYVLLLCWSVAVLQTQTALLPHLSGDWAKAIEPLSPPFGTVTIIFGAASTYLTLLSALPRILEKRSEKKPEEPQPEKDKEKS